jgi:O-antigen ligase
MLATLAYFVLAGATFLGEVIVPVQVLNVVLLAPILVAYVVNIWQADRIDKAVLLSLLLTLGAAVLSAFPRQSVDAALGALAYAAVLFVARGLLGRSDVRSMFAIVMMGLSLVVSVSLAAIWLPLFFEWWSLVDWSVVPPLNLELPGRPWGHRHDAALLIAMLYPAWWIGRPSVPRRAAAVVVGLLDLILITIDGSRTLWVALALATLVVWALPAWRRLPAMRNSKTAWVAVAIAAVAFVVLAGALTDRLTNLFSLDYRFAMWSALLQSWIEHPIAGLGPGSFPWILQTTGYFESNSLAPRHPDNAVMQQMGESGLLGLLAIAVLLVAIVPAVLRSRSYGARWALAALVFASLGSNPTDFAFIVAVTIAWVAYAVPRDRPEPRPSLRRWSPARITSLAGVAGVGVFLAASLIASTSYTVAVSAIADRRYGQSEELLSTSINLDPSLALYWRERGIVRILNGQPDRALQDLDRATVLNPSDDLALRALAVAEASTGDLESARSHANQAASVQRSDPANLLLIASLANAAEDAPSSLDALAQAVHAWPAILATSQWGEFMSGSPVNSGSVVDAAVERAESDAATPRGDPLLLTVLAGGTEPPALEDPGPLTDSLFESYRCGEGVRETLETATESDWRLPAYWVLATRESARSKEVDARAIRMLEIMHRIEIEPESAALPLHILEQNDFPSKAGSDFWGYRRLVPDRPDDARGFGELPSPSAGELTWLLDPIEARTHSGLPSC